MKTLRNLRRNKYVPGFTIVELLIVIVIIGILAAITVVSYTGITKKANEATIKSDIVNATKKLNMYYAEHNNYPDSIDTVTNCPVPADTNYCLKPGSGITFTYEPTLPGKQDFTLTATKGSIAFKATKDTTPVIDTISTFVKTWKGAGNDYGQGIIKTNDGGYATVGYTTSDSAGSHDLLLTKFNVDGNLIWSKNWGSLNADVGQGLTQLSDNGVVALGYTDSYGGGSSDVVIIKYDINGNFNWSKTWGGGGTDYGRSIAKTNDGGFVVTGQTSSYGAGGNDMFIIKYDSTGNLQWNKTWGGSGSEIGTSIIQTIDGGYAITGQVTSYGAGSEDTFIVKYNSSGVIEWNKTLGGSNTDYGNEIIQSLDGSYAIAGFTASYGAGNYDELLVKLDTNGNISWTKVWGGANYDYGQGLVYSSDGFIMNGYTNSFGAGNNDATFIKYDNAGNLVWNKTWGGSNAELVNKTVKDNNSYVTTGFTNSYNLNDVDLLLLRFNSNGDINNCTAPMCQTPSATVVSPLISVTNPSVVSSSPSAIITTPSATITSPSATVTTVVAP